MSDQLYVVEVKNLHEPSGWGTVVRGGKTVAEALQIASAALREGSPHVLVRSEQEWLSEFPEGPYDDSAPAIEPRQS